MARNEDLGADPSVPKLMEFLRTAFHPRHFDDVEEVLAAREKKWKHKTELLKEEKKTLRLDKAAVETELNELKELTVWLNNDRTAIREREKNVNAEVTELRKTIIKLENEKSTAEAEAVGWKRRFEDLEARISQLENDANSLMRQESSISKKVEGIASVKIEENVSEKNTCEVESPTHGFPTAESDNSQGAGSREHASTVVVEISDSDDDCNILPQNQMTPENPPEVSHSNWMDTKSGSFKLKRKQDDQDPKIENSCTDNSTQSSKRIHFNELESDDEQMAAKRTSRSDRSPFVLGVVYCDMESDQSVNKSISGVKEFRKWNDQIEMLLAFHKDPELCMDAVCALYRQETKPYCLTSSKHRGFIESDALRGRELAKFLIDRDQQGKRRKSKNELSAHDDKGVEDCKKIVCVYDHSERLFGIYKNQEDPLFP